MDIRNTIINNVLLAVQSLLDDQQLQAVQDALCIQLNSYEVQERSTELTVVDKIYSDQASRRKGRIHNSALLRCVLHDATHSM